MPLDEAGQILDAQAKFLLLHAGETIAGGADGVAHQFHEFGQVTDAVGFLRTAPVVGWESVKKTFVDQAARYTEFKVVLTEPKVHVLSPTSAYVTGIETFETRRTNGEAATFSANTINIYEKRGNQWLLVTHQATPIRKP